MSGMPAALKARVVADCSAATLTLKTQQAWQSSVKAPEAEWTPAKAQVREICAGIEMGTARVAARRALEKRVSITGTYRCDLLKYAAQVQGKPTLKRASRHYLTDEAERRVKLIDETGFDLTGIMCEPPAQEWERPSAMTLYSKLMVRAPGAPSVNDYEAEDLRHLTWMVSIELVDIDEDGHIHLLSDEPEHDARKYSGAPVNDDRARVGRTHTAEDVQHFVMEVWNMIVDGRPPIDIGGDYRQEMTTKRGLRMSGQMMTFQCNKLLAARMDANCNCLGRDQVRNAWDLPDHGEGCAGRERWLHVEVVRRAIRDLMVSGELTRTDEAYLTRRNHTAHRVPAAYAIPADAGWHRYATRRRTRHPRRKSALEKRLLSDLPLSGPDPFPAEFQDDPA